MKIIITGSLGNISKPLAEQLVKSGHQVTVISSKSDKVTEIEAMGAKAAIGSVSDIEFLNATFAGADVVYTMVPPNPGAANYRQYIASVGHKYADAIQKAGVKRVVNLSSIGAHLNGGTGPIAGLYDTEQLFNTLEGVAVKHLRPASFYVNFYSNIDMIKHLGFMGGNYAGDFPLVIVHPKDIADVAAEEIQQGFTGKSIRYIASDEKTGNEVATILGKAIGKPELKWVEFSDEQALGGMLQAGLPEEFAKNLVEMGTAIRSGKVVEDYLLQKPKTLAKRKLEEFAVEFASRF